MKRIREYHIESYWAAEAAKRRKRAEFKENVGDKIIIGVLIILEAVITFEFLRQIFEII